ncbi:MAG: TfoX/Sxy family protein [Anaerolinea sp.]|nr:TfoX/Sxy family protein [Anaerolinea sp.]
MVAEKYRDLHQRFEDWASSISDLTPELTFKDMFGGVLIYTAGKPMGIFWGDQIALKLPEDGQAGIINEGANDPDYTPWTPVGKQYVAVPPSVMNDEKKITYWIEDSIRYVQTLMPAKKRKRSR